MENDENGKRKDKISQVFGDGRGFEKKLQRCWWRKQNRPGSEEFHKGKQEGVDGAILVKYVVHMGAAIDGKGFGVYDNDEM